MANEILSYLDMCQREGMSLQRGMNFNPHAAHSVVLMSLRQDAPYQDELQDNGSVLIYEGHDEPQTKQTPDPKQVDQPERTRSGALTQNGLFFDAACQARDGLRPPQPVRVYEKIRQGIWSYNGLFHLIDAWRQKSGGRQVFKFKLIAVDSERDVGLIPSDQLRRRRLIPTHVKLEVWKRDNGCCVICGATDELHFDHVVPYSKGGSSFVAENVQLLCARHNIQKGDRIG